MNPIKFKEANKNLLPPSKGMPNGAKCSEMWVYTDTVECLSCWKMTFKERLKALFFGKIWVFVMSGETQPPISVNCAKTMFEKVNK